MSLHRYEKLQKKNSALEAIKKKKVLSDNDTMETIRAPAFSLGNATRRKFMSTN